MDRAKIKKFLKVQQINSADRKEERGEGAKKSLDNLIEIILLQTH